MAIKLFSATDTVFNSNGLGFIDTLRCIETKKISLNGWSVEVDVNSNYMGVIKKDCILFIDTKEKGGQPFRINDVQNLGNQLRIKANHVCFDAEDYMLVDVRPTNANPTTFLDYINKRTDKPSPFITSSTVSGNATAYFIRKSLLEGLQKSEELFGGYFDFDGFNIQLSNQVGNDEGYTVAYGKNLQGISVIESWSGVCTRLYPVGPNALTLGDTFLESEQQYDKPYTRTVTFDIPTSYQDDTGTDIPYTEAEQKAMLREKAVAYLDENQFPKINYTVKSDVEQSLRIGDLVYIKHPSVMIKASVQAYTYDVLARRVKTLEFGNYMRDVKKVFDEIKDKVEQAQGAAKDAAWIVEKQTDLINNLNKNGFVYIDENEILILDKLPKEAASNVWRFGMGGIGFSKNGYQGPFEYAFTQDGTFNANFISAGSLQVEHLHSSVGSSLNISSNEAIKMVVEKSKNIEQNFDTIIFGDLENNPGILTKLEEINDAAQVGVSAKNELFEMSSDGYLTPSEQEKFYNLINTIYLVKYETMTELEILYDIEVDGKKVFDINPLQMHYEKMKIFIDKYCTSQSITVVLPALEQERIETLCDNFDVEFQRLLTLAQTISEGNIEALKYSFSNFKTQYYQDQESFNWTFEEIQKEYGTTVSNINKYMRFGKLADNTTVGLEISTESKEFATVITEKQLEFRENQTPRAWINNRGMNFPTGVVSESLSLGNVTIKSIPGKGIRFMK